MNSWHQPSTVTTDPLDNDDTCPGCDTAHSVQPQPAPPTVTVWTCTACGLHWATTVINPILRVTLSVVGLLPTPQQRTAALLAVLRTEIIQRAQAREHTMAETVCFPLDQVVQFDAMATVDTTLWRCRICGQQGTARTTPQATSDAIAHLGIDHGGVRNCASERKRTP
jgi:ribosomal protein L37AE/L43A